MIRCHVDFSEIDPDGKFRWPREAVDRPDLLRRGVPVELCDGDGRIAEGTCRGENRRGLVVIEMTPRSLRSWKALDTLAHRVKFPRRRRICDRYDLALGCTPGELRRTAPDGEGEEGEA